MARQSTGSLALAAFVCAFAPLAQAQRNPQPAFSARSVQEDVAIGRAAALEIAGKAKAEGLLVEDEPLVAYIHRVGNSLTANIKQPFEFHYWILRDDTENAFALPGGFVFVNTGLINAVESEAELASVLGHEISHALLRHGTGRQTQAVAMQGLAESVARAVGETTGVPAMGVLAKLGGGAAAQLFLRKFSRDNESDADVLGLRLMSAAGYNPNWAPRFWEKTIARRGRSQNAVEVLLSTHPSDADRMSTLRQEIRYLPARQYSQTADIGVLPQAQARLRTTLARTAPAPQLPPGFQLVRGGTFVTLAPREWRDFSSQSSVLWAPEWGVQRQSDNSSWIHHGMNVIYFRPSRRGTLGEETVEYLRALGQANPQARVLTKYVKTAPIGGQPGLIVPVALPSPKGGTEVDIVVTTQRPEGLFVMVLTCHERELSDALIERGKVIIGSIRFPR